VRQLPHRVNINLGRTSSNRAVVSSRLMSVMLWVRLIRPDGWLITLGETMEKLSEDFQNMEINFYG
jgi:hypothetical protein